MQPYRVCQAYEALLLRPEQWPYNFRKPGMASIPMFKQRNEDF